LQAGFDVRLCHGLLLVSTQARSPLA
jgi:hypothetical protein